MTAESKQAAIVTPAGATRSRPHIPGYGIPEEEKGMLPWSHIEERMAAARNYWIGTTHPDGRPHATPVWGVWVDDTFYFGGGPDVRRSRNLRENPHVVVHLESGDDVVIIEGVTEQYTEQNADADLLKRIDDAYEAKYNMRHGTPVWAVRPRVVFAWASDLATATRWRFDTRLI